MENTGVFSRIRTGLTKTRQALTDRISELFQYYKEIDDHFFDDLTDVLIAADMGVPVSTAIVESIRAEVRREKIGSPEAIYARIRQVISQKLPVPDPAADTFPAVIVLVGVNGTGKTTTAGKLACRYKKEGRQVVLAAADTFRAAAAEQLSLWGERAQVRVIRHEEGTDPAAVVYDAAESARARGTDVLICDTAGRLHNKKNLMNELSKIDRTLERTWPDARKEVWLVLDAATGQNAIAQATVFAQATPLSGLILTKVDGTAKGGVIVAITDALGLPIRFLGVGEGIEDLQPFDAEAFAQSIL